MWDWFAKDSGFHRLRRGYDTPVKDSFAMLTYVSGKVPTAVKFNMGSYF